MEEYENPGFDQDPLDPIEVEPYLSPEKAERELKKSWENALPDPQKFIERFDKYAEKRAEETDFSMLKQDVEHMISVYFYDRGLSVLAFGEEYNKIDHMIDMFCRSIKKECSKGVGKTDDE